MSNDTETMRKSFSEIYQQKHRNRVNRALHMVGIPMIVVSLVIFLFDWRWGLGLFVLGWVLQFVGHLFEGNQPAFFKNPIYLFVGPFWWVKKLIKNLFPDRGR